jgi:hypothetical protein
MMTGNRLRILLNKLMDEKPLGLINKDLIFILLGKRERKLIERLSSSLIYQLDQDGNNLLLYIYLKVYGCRHRIFNQKIGL